MDGERYVTEQDEQAYVKRCEKLEKHKNNAKMLKLTHVKMHNNGL